MKKKLFPTLLLFTLVSSVKLYADDLDDYCPDTSYDDNLIEIPIYEVSEDNSEIPIVRPQNVIESHQRESQLQ